MSAPDLTASTEALKGVGKALAEKLAGLGIHTQADLLFHLPARYEDRTRLTPLNALLSGQSAMIVARVESAQIKYGRRRSLMVSVTDGTGRLHLRFFHFSKAQQQGLTTGQWIRAYGEVRLTRAGMEMAHPEYRQMASQEDAVDLEDRLTPVYPTTQGVTQPRLRNLMSQVLPHVDRLRELLPPEVLEDRKLPQLHAALRLIHAPRPEDDVASLMRASHPAQRRLAYEELLAQHLSLRSLRQRVRRDPAPSFDNVGVLQQRLRKQLGFELTGAQKRVLTEILTDLARPNPMMRLIQGDVGSGKTVVAAMAALAALESGYQVALMAPTELLAEQHLQNFRAWFEPLEIIVTMLSGNLKAAEKRGVLEGMREGHAGVVVGTHALFQAGVEFNRLGLIIVDEQHRFGVHQRMALREKGLHEGKHPHQLVMTATPIPRTLAMSLYADLDTSVIDELPPGRTPVTTVAIPDTRRDQVLERVALACEQGRQAYWVCTLVEESEVLQCRAAEDTAAQLTQDLPQLGIGLVHGRMKATDKESVMSDFKAGNVDLLVATTVIEVGVDVPNASLMIIDNAERLGLSQLHQLRGRVGRGSAESHCVLVYQSPLSANASARLSILRETNDGFKVAQRDLELRGPGEVLGTRQTGLVNMKIADLMRDADLVPHVHAAADRVLEKHPESVKPLIERWLGRVEAYADI